MFFKLNVSVIGYKGIYYYFMVKGLSVNIPDAITHYGQKPLKMKHIGLGGLEDLPILARDDRDGLYQSAKHQPYHHEPYPHPKADIRAHETNVDQIQRATYQGY